MLQVCNIIPVFKKREKSEATNYQPISLTSQIIKILKSIVCGFGVDIIYLDNKKHLIVYLNVEYQISLMVMVYLVISCYG